MTPPTAASGSAFAPLRSGNFRWFIASLLAMTLASEIQGLAVAWQIYAITNDPRAIGLCGLAEALPFITAALFAGHVADGRSRRAIALWALLGLAGCSLAMLALSWHAERPGIQWAIYAVIAVSGLLRSFLAPARSALGAELVPREQYAAAINWRTSTWQVGAVAGPALGGWLYAWGGGHSGHGAQFAFAVDAGLMAVALVCMLLLRHQPRVQPREREPVLVSLKGGVAFVFAKKAMLGAMSLDLFAVLFGGAVALLPVFAKDILHVDTTGLGVLRAGPAAGALVMAIVLTFAPPLRRAGPAILVAVAAFGGCMIGFGLSSSFALSLALLVLSGAVDYISVVIRQTLVQVMTPPNLLGRVSAVNQIFIGSSNEIGAFESGFAADLLGTVPSVVVGGAITLAVVAITAWRVPELRRLGRLEEAAPKGE